MSFKTMARAAILLMCGAASAAPFTFQSELRDGGAAVKGVFDLQFSLYGAAVSGTQFGSVLCAENVVVSNGRFTTVLDFGNVFDGADRFLKIQLREDTGLSYLQPWPQSCHRAAAGLFLNGAPKRWQMR